MLFKSLRCSDLTSCKHTLDIKVAKNKKGFGFVCLLGFVLFCCLCVWVFWFFGFFVCVCMCVSCSGFFLFCFPLLLSSNSFGFISMRLLAAKMNSVICKSSGTSFGTD